MTTLLAPVHRDMTEEFNRGLVGMMENPVILDALVETREEMITDIVSRMPETHRHFLLSFQSGKPDWSLLEVPHAMTLPAVQWQMGKLKRLDERERANMVAGLEAILARSTG